MTEVDELVAICTKTACSDFKGKCDSSTVACLQLLRIVLVQETKAIGMKGTRGARVGKGVGGVGVYCELVMGHGRLMGDDFTVLVGDKEIDRDGLLGGGNVEVCINGSTAGNLFREALALAKSDVHLHSVGSVKGGEEQESERR